MKEGLFSACLGYHLTVNFIFQSARQFGTLPLQGIALLVFKGMVKNIRTFGEGGSGTVCHIGENSAIMTDNVVMHSITSDLNFVYHGVFV